MVHKKEYREYVEKTYGKGFQPDDFIPMFTAENYQPEKLMQLAADAGMKYAIPFCKHRDGFCLWPSTYTDRDAMDMGSRRDLIHPLVNECSRLGLKIRSTNNVKTIMYGCSKLISHSFNQLFDKLFYLCGYLKNISLWLQT